MNYSRYKAQLSSMRCLNWFFTQELEPKIAAAGAGGTVPMAGVGQAKGIDDSAAGGDGLDVAGAEASAREKQQQEQQQQQQQRPVNMQDYYEYYVGHKEE